MGRYVGVQGQKTRFRGENVQGIIGQGFDNRIDFENIAANRRNNGMNPKNVVRFIWREGKLNAGTTIHCRHGMPIEEQNTNL